MLRIERNSRNREYSISMRKKSPGIGTRQLWTALGIALAIHVVGILLFRFPLFDFKNLSTPQPALVQAIIMNDPTAETRADWTPHQGTRLLSDYLLAPRSTLPPLPEWQNASMSNISFSSRSNDLALFHEIERLDTLMKPTVEKLQPTETQVQIFVSGPLANYAYTHDSVDVSQLAHHYRFDVKVDAATGRVCWCHPVGEDSALTPQEIALGEQVLCGMRFQRHPSHVMTHGEVEITIVKASL